MDRLAALKYFAAATLLASSGLAAPLSAVEADQARIRAHLARVATELEAKDVSHLSPALRSERQRNIARLDEYRLRGEFPHNTDHPGERVPYFIDREGRACAVGALIIESGHSALAGDVERRENNARLKDMTTPGLSEWVANSGLSLDECAQIQPSYCDESRCTDGLAPVCGTSGESYACLRVLEECSDDEYAYDGECVDGGPPDGGPLVVTSADGDDGGGCALNATGSGRSSGALFLAGLLALGLFHRRASRWRY